MPHIPSASIVSAVRLVQAVAVCFAIGLAGSSLAASAAEPAAPVLPMPTLTKVVPAGLSDDQVPPQPVPVTRAPAGAPNVVVVLLDDVGFGAAGTFGGPIPTPALNRLAHQGLRYNTFHTAAICSPTRAALLTGRNPHAVGMGAVRNTAASYPGRNSLMPKSAATIAEILRQNGYATSAWGKWHLVPAWEQSQAGPFDRWPTGMGFDKFYGFIDGETDQFEPTLIEGTTLVARPNRGHYHLTEDLAERAIGWMQQQKSLASERPFFVYFAPGATHSPLHAPKEWIERFRGRFDQGWDKLREETFARQKSLGVVPANTVLTPRMAELPAWETLSPERRRIASRLMETYAGFLAHTDEQIGRMVAALQQMGEFDNTLFVYIVGDNGGSAEGGVFGTLDEMGRYQGVNESTESILARLDEVGGPKTHPHYPAGWAWAMNTPFQFTKQVASHLGGTRNPLVMSWPRRIRDVGGLRSQFSYVSDIAPTILEASGIPAPAMVNGVAQQPMDGESLVYSFDDAKAPERHRTQYFEVFGNRALYHDGWMASAFHGFLPWKGNLGSTGRSFADDIWELYNLREDFSQGRNLAAAQPAKLRELQDLFLAEAGRNNVLPMSNKMNFSRDLPELSPKRDRYVYHAGNVGVPESVAPPVVGRSHAVRAEVVVPANGAEGVIVAEGGSSAGWSLYVTGQGRPAYAYNLFGIMRKTLQGPAPLPAGPANVGVNFKYDGGGYGKGATVHLLVNGQVVAEDRLERTVPVFFSIDETFDVGTDSGSPVGEYRANYSFTGQIGQVGVTLQ